MSAENSIILVTNDGKIEEILKPKLILLREVDAILSTGYDNAIKTLKENTPDAILLHCAHEKQKCLNLIHEIKNEEALNQISILLLIEEYDQNFILNAYDENISDYLTLKNDDAEILMRIIWCLKKNSLEKTVAKQHNLLERLEIIEKETGLYANKSCEKILENELKLLKESGDDGILMAVAPSEDSKTTLGTVEFADAIKKSTRNSDTIAHGPLNKFFILLPRTTQKGAFSVWEKIKTAVGEEYTINAGISTVGDKSFATLKSELLNALIEAENTKNDLIIVNNEQIASNDWLDKINAPQKNFKLFKQAFNKKLDKVITPVFFQFQKLYEEKLYKTQIEQFSNSKLSSFSLKTKTNESELKITYPGFSKINIDTIHQGLDSPENKRISLDLTELDESRLTEILEEFIKEFKAITEA